MSLLPQFTLNRPGKSSCASRGAPHRVATLRVRKGAFDKALPGVLKQEPFLNVKMGVLQAAFLLLSIRLLREEIASKISKFVSQRSLFETHF